MFTYIKSYFIPQQSHETNIIVINPGFTNAETEAQKGLVTYLSHTAENTRISDLHIGLSDSGAALSFLLSGFELFGGEKKKKGESPGHWLLAHQKSNQPTNQPTLK